MKKKEIIGVRMTREEKRYVKKIAKLCGISVSAVIISALDLLYEHSISDERLDFKCNPFRQTR